jgi:hypothetical protein
VAVRSPLISHFKDCAADPVRPTVCGYWSLDSSRVGVCSPATVLSNEKLLDHATVLFQQTFILQVESMRTENFSTIAYHLSGLGAMLSKESRLDEAKRCKEAEALFQIILNIRLQRHLGIIM